jgi:hypothetical protein
MGCCWAAAAWRRARVVWWGATTAAAAGVRVRVRVAWERVVHVVHAWECGRGLRGGGPGGVHSAAMYVYVCVSVCVWNYRMLKLGRRMNKCAIHVRCERGAEAWLYVE